jgi:predicted nucleic acid-binding Zn ribbon protein
MLDDDDDDPELPDESDTDSFDEPSLDACPHCNKLIDEDTERCPHCGEYISAADAPRKLPVWMIVGVILLAICFIVWMFVSGT